MRKSLDLILVTVFASAFSALISSSLLTQAKADNVSTPARQFTFVSGGTIRASDINSELNNIITGLANIGTANILASGVGTSELADLGVTEGKLAAAVTAKLHFTGQVVDYIGTSTGSPPTGWVWANGQTIGNASSAGTARANADTEALFLLIYAGMADAEAPVSGGRGASAAADYAANKTITLPDMRGRASYGDGNMGGTSDIARITATLNFDGTVLGKAGGAATHTNTSAEMFQHTHTATHGHPGSTADAHTHLPPIGGGGSTLQWLKTDGTASQFNPSGGDFVFNSSQLVAANTPTQAANVNTLTISAPVLTTASTGSTAAYSTLSNAIVTNKLIKL